MPASSTSSSTWKKHPTDDDKPATYSGSGSPPLRYPSDYPFPTLKPGSRSGIVSSHAFWEILPLSSSKSHSLMWHKPNIFNDPHVLDLSLRLLAGTDMINVLQPIALFGPVEWQVERPPLGSIDGHAKFLRIPKRHVLSATDDPMLLACRYRRAPEIHCRHSQAFHNVDPCLLNSSLIAWDRADDAFIFIDHCTKLLANGNKNTT